LFSTTLSTNIDGVGVLVGVGVGVLVGFILGVGVLVGFILGVGVLVGFILGVGVWVVNVITSTSHSGGQLSIELKKTSPIFVVIADHIYVGGLLTG
jgi:hypothetical protein